MPAVPAVPAVAAVPAIVAVPALLALPAPLALPVILAGGDAASGRIRMVDDIAIACLAASVPPLQVQELFKRIDDDGNGTITKEEAMKFWGKNWAKVNAQAMFNEVDQDGEDAISKDKWLEFWKNVVASGYPQDDVLEEVDMILSGGSWVDFDDGRTT